MIEKNFTLPRSISGPDSFFSLEPDEMRALVEGVRSTDAVLGKPTFGPTDSEIPNLSFRGSLFVMKDLKQGGLFTKENLRSVCPWYGLLPKFFDEVLGRGATRDVSKGTPLSWDMVAKDSRS